MCVCHVIRMDSITDTELRPRAEEKMEAGVQRLSAHFTWPEFCDQRRAFHQDFVYNVTMFAATCGFPWSEVAQAALMAKALFPKLDCPDVPTLLSMLRDMLSEYMPDLGSAQRIEFTRFLTDTCVRQRRLFQAALRGATEETAIQLRMEVQSPPTPCPLAQGVDLQEWESEEKEAELRALLQQKEEKLKQLRNGERVSVEEIEVPEDGEANREKLFVSLNSAVKATKEQILASLTQEVNLLTEILQLKLKKAEMTTRGPQTAAESNPDNSNSQPETTVKGKKLKSKTKK
ncbi:uncharacterized protein C8orf74 homolog isoform X2 [Takifugu rubripes]|uniref:uncharacterized protein C8orf74 homolog isoform X2 n=1 Tax=Takifugu rubripes TaxID=31033 RepID=UPI001145A037|nr:uncharacterized protein C8orf74 homolog isoform X2 [Takifugu rubripes]